MAKMGRRGVGPYIGVMIHMMKETTMAFIWQAAAGATLVMAVLAGLCALMALLAKRFSRGTAVPLPEIPEPAPPAQAKPAPAIPSPATPQIELIETDEATAAILMAIVAERSGIPPEKLAFKRITLIPNS